MDYRLAKEVIGLLQTFEKENNQRYSVDIEGFQQWIYEKQQLKGGLPEPYWEGKENGRSPESAINTMIVHMNRYAKTYSKSAIWGSDFTSQEDFIYLITLKAFGAMSKMELIKRNIQEKPTGMLIIGRLLKQGWVKQKPSEKDKRSKVICLTEEGLKALATQMKKIRQATQIVTGDLTHAEKMELIRLLDKLEKFHNPIFSRNLSPETLLDDVFDEYLKQSC